MNNWLLPSVIMALLSSVLMTALYGYLYIKEQKTELKIFLIAWVVYCIRFVVAIIIIFVPEWDSLTSLMHMLTLLNSALLLMGSRLMLKKKPRKTLNRIMLLSPLIVVFNLLTGLDDFISTTIVFILVGFIYILVGLNFIKNQRINRGIKYFIGIVFILWGLHKFDYPFLYDSEVFAKIGYMMNGGFTIVSALFILMLYYETQKDYLYEKAAELRESKEDVERLNLLLHDTRDKLKLKLDYVLNPERDDSAPLELTDIIDLDMMQRIQDSFAEATGVAAIITDTEGCPITKPSNFTDLCTLIRQTGEGLQNCIKSDKSIGDRAARLLCPVVEECHSCGLIDAAAPIIVGNKHVANWMIGQSSIGGSDDEKIENYAAQIGADKRKMLEAFHRIESSEIEKFEKVVNLLWVFSQEISAYAYNNISLARKIEDNRASRQALLREKERAEENDRLKDAFLANISHEIRTPLNGILGFSELLRTNDFSKDERFNFIDLINKSGKRLLDTIDDIIYISMIQTEQIEVNSSRFNLNALIERVRAKYESPASEKGLSLNYSGAEDLEIYSDEEKVFVILSKLVGNAVKYTSEGYISIGCNFPDSMVEIIVEDTGIGISRKKIESIFNRFEQAETDYSRAHEGLGLGLSITKAYAETLGGEIRIESSGLSKDKDRESWSRFKVLLPINHSV